MRDQRTDLLGNPYATVRGTGPGNNLFADGDFTCIRKGATVVVTAEKRTGRLYIPCRSGKHFLDGQLSDDGKYYVGLYPQFAKKVRVKP